MEEAVNSATWIDIEVSTCTLQFSLLVCRTVLFIYFFALLVNSAQLPVSGGCGDGDQPGLEEYESPFVCQSHG